MSDYRQLTALDLVEAQERSPQSNYNALLGELGLLVSGMGRAEYQKLLDANEFAAEVRRQISAMGDFDVTDAGWTFQLVSPVKSVNEVEVAELEVEFPNAGIVNGVGAHGKYRQHPWQNLWTISKCCGHRNTGLVEQLAIGDYSLIADVLGSHIVDRFGGLSR